MWKRNNVRKRSFFLPSNAKPVIVLLPAASGTVPGPMASRHVRVTSAPLLSAAVGWHFLAGARMEPG